MEGKIIDIDEDLVHMAKRRDELHRHEQARAFSFGTGMWVGVLLGLSVYGFARVLGGDGVAFAAVVAVECFIVWTSSKFNPNRHREGTDARQKDQA